jgi:acyl dehydratase
VNPAAEGKTYPDVPFELDPDHVARFGALFDDPTAVPPTVLTAAEFAVIPSIVGDPELGLDFARVVHGSQEYVFRRPLAVGERLRARTRLASIRLRGGAGFLTIETELLDDDDGVAAVARSLMIERDAS